MKNQKIRNDFFAHTQEVIEYYAVIIAEASTEERSLKALLIDHTNSCLFSLFTYIDGATGVKNLELVNADTGVEKWGYVRYFHNLYVVIFQTFRSSRSTLCTTKIIPLNHFTCPCCWAVRRALGNWVTELFKIFIVKNCVHWLYVIDWQFSREWGQKLLVFLIVPYLAIQRWPLPVFCSLDELRSEWVLFDITNHCE